MNTEEKNLELLPILVATDPFLRKKARLVEEKDLEEVRKIVPVMFNTMYDAPGIGLAAPQVGIGLRFFIMDLAKEGDEKEQYVILNPEIIEESEDCSEAKEGCLSVPEQFSEVIRPEKIKLRYMDLDGKQQEMQADDLLARCIQHETDHLDGILFIDHLSSLKRNMIMRKIIKDQRKSR
ncbi:MULTISPECIES: peptide deformylase [Commensalibacter]|uniref:Peptide deformylase n=2 Tax=Commensalibacter TaxID=1079922 RepID=W7E1J3_9PROT|nr:MULTISPECIES: peptide deformylase [Commensalibacter]EUK18954.1 N-formylmethionylaminoacyl-tRNA deformylase [Commensalibacter papalotli (ex Servin-Garciduenas et al. 2014)]CAI3925141.1 Peptide deformylase (Def) (PDB:1BS4) [Commensalibacter papalotli (ex Botero et al. 2024)]CAI3926914.1 Peptide deformylase (Def) (PDB:1BS4) [Commensalibacter papalotli (ex Botero et al. 2024)]